jgi:protein-serine/threonine kinase
MTSPSRRPLPTPPSATGTSPQGHHLGPLSADMHFSQYQQPYPQFGSSPRLNLSDEPPTTTLPGGTLLHQGFYDLLAMVPTPSPSRLLWGAGWNQQPVVARPQYEDQSPQVKSIPTPQISTPTASKKSRRIPSPTR